MWCCQCHRDLSECICPDLKDRLEVLKKSPYLHFDKEQLAKYEAQAEKNQQEQTKQE